MAYTTEQIHIVKTAKLVIVGTSDCGRLASVDVARRTDWECTEYPHKVRYIDGVRFYGEFDILPYRVAYRNDINRGGYFTHLWQANGLHPPRTWVQAF